MHHSIIELGLTMMFHAKLPSWLNYFSTIVFLLNMLPSITPGMDSHFSQLYGKTPDYGTFRVLGSRYFAYLGAYCSNKLEPKSIPCVFICYSTKHKWYRCLYPPTSHVYISRHDVFDESLLPYSKPTALYGQLSAEGKFCTFSNWTNQVPPSASPSMQLPLQLLPLQLTCVPRL